MGTLQCKEYEVILVDVPDIESYNRSSIVFVHRNLVFTNVQYLK